MEKSDHLFINGIFAFFMGLVLLSSFEMSHAQNVPVPDGMTYVPAGFFVMGIDKEPSKTLKVKKMSPIKQLKFAVSKEAFHDEGPAHVVLLDGYFIDRTEVSNRSYKAFMDATGHPAPAYWDDHRFNKPNQPVTGVNWNDADAYCQWANKRLPTEAEWEKAARGPEGFIYPWGNELDGAKANFGRNKEATSEVNAFADGKSGYGVLNMAGNVFEWVADWYDPNFYKNNGQRLNPGGPEQPVVMGTTGTYVDRITAGSKKVIRGGSWFSPGQTITTTHRFWNNPMNNSYGIGLGFRCAKELEKEDSLQARELYMNALIGMGAEKYPDALISIDKAIHADPENAEYIQLRKMIEKQVK